MQGNVAVVTGGSTGIGAEICRSLLAEGYHVVSVQRREAAVKDSNLTSVSADLLDVKATEACATEIAKRFAVTHFIHNAGAIRANLLENTSVEDLAALSQLHLGSAITFAQAFVPGMKERRDGRIILISSRAAVGVPTRTVYSATKAGMLGMSRTWALEMAAFGITVNVVAPGPIGGTEMFHDVFPEGDPRIAQLASGIPVKRLGTPADVAHAVKFFCSPMASFVTGQALYVCGGSSVGAIAL